ncbi:hypothetical protein RRG08_011935 [Elysia crispata]|uniref:Uncharacterized protein n=1 Tax=Elysia crispata TaxID=231223 RepID=A0AAE1CMZ1_9GAST|nr:hypothetical protein RRG08_011935 [Elysia crispata]
MVSSSRHGGRVGSVETLISVANEGRQELGRGGKEVEDRAGWMEEGGERLEKRELLYLSRSNKSQSVTRRTKEISSRHHSRGRTAEPRPTQCPPQQLGPFTAALIHGASDT